jgi:hypothetical protein
MAEVWLIRRGSIDEVKPRDSTGSFNKRPKINLWSQGLVEGQVLIFTARGSEQNTVK